MPDERGAIGFGLMLVSYGSGVLDILSYRFLGDVFPSALTGNLALLGLALGRGDLAAAIRNMTVFAGFVVGVAAAAALLRPGAKRGRLVLAAALEALLLLAFAVAWPWRDRPMMVLVIIAGAAAAMGLQSGLAHRIGVRSVNTTFFTGPVVSMIFGLISPPGQPELRHMFWPSTALVAYVVGAVSVGVVLGGSAPGWAAAAIPAVPCATAGLFALLLAVVGAPAR